MSDLVQRRKALADEVMREGICKAAASVLAEVGYAALTMERVAEATGVSKGTLYNYFQDKDALVLEVIEQAFAGLVRSLDEALAKASGPVAAVRETVRLALLGIEERRALGQALCSHMLSPRVEGYLRERQLSLRRRFSELLRQAQAAGLLRVSAAPEVLGRFLALVLDGVVAERMRHGEESPPVGDEFRAIEELLLREWFAGGHE